MTKFIALTNCLTGQQEFVNLDRIETTGALEKNMGIWVRFSSGTTIKYKETMSVFLQRAIAVGLPSGEAKKKSDVKAGG